MTGGETAYPPKVPPGGRANGNLLRGSSTRKRRHDLGGPRSQFANGVRGSELRPPDVVSTVSSTSSMGESVRTSRSVTHNALSAVQQLYPKYQGPVVELCRYIQSQCSRSPAPNALELVQEWLDIQRSSHAVSNVDVIRNSRDKKLYEVMQGYEKRTASPARGSSIPISADKLKQLTSDEVESLAEAMGSHLRNSGAVYTKLTHDTFVNILQGNAPALVPKAEDIFNMLDDDKSGDINFKEFMAALLAARSATPAVAADDDSSVDSKSLEGNLSRSHSAPQIKTAHRSDFYEKKKRAMDAATEGSAKPLSPAETKREINDLVTHINSVREEITVLSMIGSPTDDDLDLLEQKRSYYDGTKLKLATRLEGHDSTEAPTPEEKEKWGELLSRLIEEGDDRTGALELMSSMLKHIGPEVLADAVQASDAFVNNCVDGNIKFLRVMLDYQRAFENSFDRVDLVTSACFSQSNNKVDLMFLILDRVSISGLCDDLQDVMTDTFIDLISSADVARHALMEKLLSHDELHLLLSTDNCLVPCCKVGDCKLLELLVQHASHIVRPTAVLEDGTSAILQAIMHDHSQMVTALLKLDCDPDVEMEAGTPLGIASALGRSSIVSALTHAGAKKKLCHLEQGG